MRGSLSYFAAKEPQEFLVAPVGIIGGAVAARVFGIRLGVGLVRLDVVGDCGGALYLLGAARCVRDGCARVLDAEPHDGLVSAARDIVEHLFEAAPVVVNLVVGLALHHGAGEAVREFERNGFLQILFRYLFRQVQKIKYIVVKENVAGIAVSLRDNWRKICFKNLTNFLWAMVFNC